MTSTPRPASDAAAAAEEVARLATGHTIRLLDGRPMTVERSARGGPWLLLRDDDIVIRVLVEVTFTAGGGLGSLDDERLAPAKDTLSAPDPPARSADVEFGR